MENGRFHDLVNSGILRPSSKDWRVSIFFVDGTSRTVRISPSKMSEEVAIDRALSHCKIFDRSIVDRIEASRVEKSTQVVSTGIIQKGKKEE